MQNQTLISPPLSEKNAKRGYIPLNQLSQNTWSETATQFKNKNKIQKSSKIHKVYYC